MPQSSAMRVKQSQRWSAISNSRRVRRPIGGKLARIALKAKFSVNFYDLLRFTLLFLLGLPLVGCYSGNARDLHASVVQDYLPTPGIDLAESYSDPDRGLGAPDGRTVALGLGSALSLRFFRAIPNGLGPDLRVIELGPDNAKARIAVSQDGTQFFEYESTANSGGAALFDFDAFGLERVVTVRVRGLDNEGEDPGFDLDALEALH